MESPLAGGRPVGQADIDRLREFISPLGTFDLDLRLASGIDHIYVYSVICTQLPARGDSPIGGNDY
jgi:hypothetical protein